MSNVSEIERELEQARDQLHHTQQIWKLIAQAQGRI